jgi:hypothetical protein
MTISTKNLTGGEVEGSGFYDELMRTSKAHLVQEFEAGRLVGAEYGAAYLGMMQNNLQVASQFILQQEINNQQVLLLQEQVEQAKKQNSLLNLQLTKQQIDNVTAQYQLDNLLPEQVATQVEQTKLVTAQVAQAGAQTTLIGTQDSVAQADSTAKINNLAKQDDLLDEKIATEQANLTDPTGGLMLKQFNKTEEEVKLLKQKRFTEEAQTSDTVDGSGVGGLLAKEIALKDKQAESFTRDAEQKAAKIMSDTFSIIFSTDQESVEDQSNWGLGSANSRNAIETMLQNINVPIA